MFNFRMSKYVEIYLKIQDIKNIFVTRENYFPPHFLAGAD
jgi:hypothetical protein